MTRGPGEERQECLLGDPSSSVANIYHCITVAKIYIYLCCSRLEISYLLTKLKQYTV